MKLVLLDIDGSLTDTNDVDTSCFIQEGADFLMPDLDGADFYPQVLGHRPH